MAWQSQKRKPKSESSRMDGITDNQPYRTYATTDWKQTTEKHIFRDIQICSIIFRSADDCLAALQSNAGKLQHCTSNKNASNGKQLYNRTVANGELQDICSKT